MLGGMSNTSEIASVLEVDRSNPFQEIRTIEEKIAESGEGSLILAVERFSLSANNLTYVLLGDDVLRSWDAFPARASGWGRVPVWGVARVVGGDPSVAKIGDRWTGYLPMATHVSVHVAPSEFGLLTTDEPRASMLPCYRRLTPYESGAEVDDHRADMDTVMLSVFPFAALITDDLVRMGVPTVVVSSASSRVSTSVSRLLGIRGIRVVGLTSPRNRADVESLGTYASVLTYAEIDQLDDSAGTVFVDVAGSAEITEAVHRRLGNQLEASVAVGGTHIRALPPVAAPGPLVTQFNAGDRESEVLGERGVQALQKLYSDARAELIAWAPSWLKVTPVAGLDATKQVWRDIAAGKSNPLEAKVIRP